MPVPYVPVWKTGFHNEKHLYKGFSNFQQIFEANSTYKQTSVQIITIFGSKSFTIELTTPVLCATRFHTTLTTSEVVQSMMTPSLI